MEVDKIRPHEVAVLCRIRGARRLQNVSRHLPKIELAEKQVVAVLMTENIGIVALQSTGRRRAQRVENRHELTGPRMTVEHTVLLAIHAAVDRVNQAVIPRIHVKESARQN